MSRVNEKDQEKLKRRLNALLRLPENKTCAECGQRQPQWASVNLGMFFCIRCSGIHRNLGVHISMVRSTTLDTWNDKWVSTLEEWGNERANAYWEHTKPGARKPTENTGTYETEQFIRDKYVRGVWKAKGTPEEALAAAHAHAGSSNSNAAHGSAVNEEEVRHCA